MTFYDKLLIGDILFVLAVVAALLSIKPRVRFVLPSGAKVSCAEFAESGGVIVLSDCDDGNTYFITSQDEISYAKEVK